jgi:hypothetical protein
MRFVAFLVIAVGVLVFIVVPLVAGPILTGMARDAGFRGATVSLDLFGSSILSGRAPGVRLQGSDVTIPHGTVASLDVTLHDVGLDRSFSSISGELHRLELSAPGGRRIRVESVTLDGPADAALARGTLDAEQAGALVRLAIEDAGFSVDEVRLRDGSIQVRRSGISAEGSLRVAGGALLLETAILEPLVLLAPAPSESWRLEDVTVASTGMTVDVIVDAAALAKGLPAAGG